MGSLWFEVWDEISKVSTWNWFQDLWVVEIWESNRSPACLLFFLLVEAFSLILCCFVLYCLFHFLFLFFFLIFFILNLVLIGLKFGGRTYVLMTCHNRTFVQLNWGVGVMLVILFLKYWMKKCIKINIILFKNWKYMFKIDY